MSNYYPYYYYYLLCRVDTTHNMTGGKLTLIDREERAERRRRAFYTLGWRTTGLLRLLPSLDISTFNYFVLTSSLIDLS